MENGKPSGGSRGEKLKTRIRRWGQALGFQQMGFSGVELEADQIHLERWLAQDRHGEMGYMARHGSMRARPQQLLPGTITIISARLDYLPETEPLEQVLLDPALGAISRYALGRDYHKLVRRRLQQLARAIETETGPFNWRSFSDSAPILEKAVAQKSGLGWIGKHTNLINRHAGSWFFLGELLTDLSLSPDSALDNHCGSCRRCLDICPTQAIIAPYELDARRCVSYLTIEHPGSIPEPLRPLLGSRIYGCDDCQLVCPWNRYAGFTAEPDFAPRNGLERPRLTDLFAWTEEAFLKRLEGSPIRRIGHQRWLRNIAIALGNGAATKTAVQALARRADHPSELVREHVQWALNRISRRHPGC